MPAPKALASIRSRRVVYVAGADDDAGADLLRPLADRIRNNSDEDETTVSWHGSDNWIDVQRRQWLEEVTDLIVVLDDRLMELLRDPKCSLDLLDDETLNGRELLVVFRCNDDRRSAGSELARLWAAKAARVELIGLKRIAGRDDWSLLREDQEERLHWLYAPNEKILTGVLVRGRLSGEDEDRLASAVGRFVEHQPQKCDRCGKQHGADQ